MDTKHDYSQAQVFQTYGTICYGRQGQKAARWANEKKT